MQLRPFGATGIRVSALGFGAWAIGGQAYGAVDRAESLRALARAEELGCNFVDTAAVYGDSEAVLGEFLAGRRARWVVSTKYSGQPEGLARTLESQLRALRTDAVDFYMVHWAPGRGEDALYEALASAKRAGKARAVGVSLKTAADIDRVLAQPVIDGFMLRLSLLDPDPFLQRRERIRKRRAAVVVRSALREGFLGGKYGAEARFDDPADQRHGWSREQVAALARQVERFRFLEAECGALALAAARYPLAFDEVSTVALGTRTPAQAEQNFGAAANATLGDATLARIAQVQHEAGLRMRPPGLLQRARQALRRLLP